MSIDLYVLTPYTVDELRPSLLGLGQPPFSWPDADSPSGFSYPNARLRFSATSFPDEVAADDDDGVYRRLARFAPATMKSVLSLRLRDYRTDFESSLAHALGGTHSSDAMLYSEIWDAANGDASEDSYTYDDETPEQRMVSAQRSILPALPDADQCARAQRRVRAAFWGDRYPLTSAERAAMIDAAIANSEDALAVLRFWSGEGLDHRDERACKTLRALLVTAIERAGAAPESLLDLFSTPTGAELNDKKTLALLERVMPPSAMKAFVARAEANAQKHAESLRYYQQAKLDGDFI
jgi:hypothetical protein